MRRPRRARGLTLVELLVTVSFVVLVAAAVAATFAGGMRVWGRLQAHGIQGLWLQVALAQLRQDLRNARHFTPIPFEGRHDRVSFPALLPATADAETAVWELGQRGYFFDGHRRTLCRAQQPYRLLRQTRLQEACQPVLTDISQVRFSYYKVESATATTSWQDSWSSTELPLAVRCEVSYGDPLTHRPHTQSLLVHLPLARPFTEGLEKKL